MFTWMTAGAVWMYCDLLIGVITFAWGVGGNMLAKRINDMGADPNS